jgi:small subunit ribosomal protein S9
MIKETKTKKIQSEKKARPIKKTVAKTKKKKEEKEVPAKKEVLKYWEGVGGRKTAMARVRIFKDGEKKILINGKECDVYFPLPEISQLAVSPLKKLDLLNRLTVIVKIKGGGITSQAGAVRHGLSRALVKYNEKYRQKLRQLGYLTRDPRMRERKKFGLKRARRAPQWSKR